MSANFTPDMTGYKGLSPFRFWCQKTLPLVYDDSLSYYELLCKVVSYINNLITDVAAAEENVDKLLTAYNQLQEYVNEYFDGADFQQKIDDSLDRYAEDGTLSSMVNTHVSALLPYEVGQQIGPVVDEDLGPVVDLKLPAVVESKIAAPVATQLPAVVQTQIGGVVGNQIGDVVADQIDEVVADQITDAVSPLVHDEVTGLIRPAVSAELPAALQVYLPPEVQTQLPGAIGTDLETIAPHVIEDWLDAHPEATTSVPDGSISFSKLATDLQRRAGIVGTYFPSDFTDEYAWQVNQYAVYQGIVYRCIKTTTAGQAWNASEWTTANMNSDLFYMWWCLNYLSQSITTIDSSPATSAHEAGEYFIYYDGSHLYRLAKASSNIAVGDTLTPNGNFIYSSVANMIADLKVEIADLKSALNQVKNGKVLLKPTTIFENTWINSNGQIAPNSGSGLIVKMYTMEADKQYTIKSDGDYINYSITDTLYTGSSIWPSLHKVYNDESSVTFINPEGYKYLYVMENRYGAASTLFNIAVFSPLLEDEAERLTKANNILDNLRVIDGEYVPVALGSAVTGKYLYAVEGQSANNGVPQNDSGFSYTTANVVPGERYRISGTGRRYAPIVLFYADPSICNNRSYMGAVEFVSANKEYKNFVFEIPDGCNSIGINMISGSIVFEKYTPIKKINFMSDLDINSFAHNPFEYVGDEISVFDKILCIGDSTTFGGMNSPNITPDQSHATRVVSGGMYSYPTFIKKMYGVNNTVKAKSGITSAEWLNQFGSDDLTGHDCAIILLGHNNHHYITDDGMTVEEATAQTVTDFRAIINLVQTSNYGIPVFICTTLYNFIDQYGLAGSINRAIKELAEELPGVYLIDLAAYSKTGRESAYTNTHPTAIGYQEMALGISASINFTIHNNPDDFKWIAYVGTQYAVAIG